MWTLDGPIFLIFLSLICWLVNQIIISAQLTFSALPLSWSSLLQSTAEFDAFQEFFQVFSVLFVNSYCNILGLLLNSVFAVRDKKALDYAIFWFEVVLVEYADGVDKNILLARLILFPDYPLLFRVLDFLLFTWPGNRNRTIAYFSWWKTLTIWLLIVTFAHRPISLRNSRFQVVYLFIIVKNNINNTSSFIDELIPMPLQSYFF